MNKHLVRRLCDEFPRLIYGLDLSAVPDGWSEIVRCLAAELTHLETEWMVAGLKIEAVGKQHGRLVFIASWKKASPCPSQSRRLDEIKRKFSLLSEQTCEKCGEKMPVGPEGPYCPRCDSDSEIPF